MKDFAKILLLGPQPVGAIENTMNKVLASTR